MLTNNDDNLKSLSSMPLGGIGGALASTSDFLSHNNPMSASVVSKLRGGAADKSKLPPRLHKSNG